MVLVKLWRNASQQYETQTNFFRFSGTFVQAVAALQRVRVVNKGLLRESPENLSHALFTMGGE